MDYSQQPLTSYQQKKIAIEQLDDVQVLAALAVAETDLRVGASINMYNSCDRADPSIADDQPSFLKINDCQSRQNTSRHDCSKILGALDSDDNFRVHIQDNCSEDNATQPQLKRHNLVEMFLRGTKVDEYIIKNMYGRERFVDPRDPNNTLGEVTMLEGLNLDETFTHQMQLLHRKSLYGAHGKSGGDQNTGGQGLNAFQTYIALIKGYCCLLVLVLPKAFTRGGYVVSPACIIVSGLIQMIAANKLVQTGKSLGLKSYSLITLKLLGPRAKSLLDIMIAATQFSFTISWGAYVCEAWRGLLLSLFDVKVGPWTTAAVLIVMFTLIAWVRDISKFSSTMLIGNLCILSTLIVVSGVMIKKYVERDFQLASGIVAHNKAEFWSMVGFACYTFEGIGVVMPIMHACECPDKFPKILLYAFITLTALYCFFGNWCYLIMGPKMAHTFIIEELDQKSLIIILLNLIYSVNLVCSYAIVIYPTNTILEEYLFSGLSKRINNRTELGRKYKRLRYNLQNFSRFLVCLSAIYLAVELREKMDKFLSLLGALLCAPLAILYPALLHLVGIAKTKREKIGDIVLLVIALTVMTFSTVQSVSTW